MPIHDPDRPEIDERVASVAYIEYLVVRFWLALAGLANLLQSQAAVDFCLRRYYEVIVDWNRDVEDKPHYTSKPGIGVDIIDAFTDKTNGDAWVDGLTDRQYEVLDALDEKLKKYWDDNGN